MTDFQAVLDRADLNIIPRSGGGYLLEYQDGSLVHGLATATPGPLVLKSREWAAEYVQIRWGSAVARPNSPRPLEARP